MKILVIEDSERLCRSLKKGFRTEGISADFVMDGEQGLSFGLAKEYDVIVLDIMLPKLGGLKILESLRQNGILTRVLILSSKRQVTDRIKGLELGADDYLTKPFSFDELCARIKALSRRNYAQAKSILDIRNLKIDTARVSVSCDGEPLHLTRSEYQILECLALRQGRLVTKESLIEWIHESEKDTQSNIIESLMSTLRKKITSSCAKNKDLIQTKRGFGYIIY